MSLTSSPPVHNNKIQAQPNSSLGLRRCQIRVWAVYKYSVISVHLTTSFDSSLQLLPHFQFLYFYLYVYVCIYEYSEMKIEFISLSIPWYSLMWYNESLHRISDRSFPSFKFDFILIFILFYFYLINSVYIYFFNILGVDDEYLCWQMGNLHLIYCDAKLTLENWCYPFLYYILLLFFLFLFSKINITNFDFNYCFFNNNNNLICVGDDDDYIILSEVQLLIVLCWIKFCTSVWSTLSFFIFFW